MKSASVSRSTKSQLLLPSSGVPSAKRKSRDQHPQGLTGGSTQGTLVLYTNDEGESRDVTNEVTLSLALPYLGTFEGNIFTGTADRAGRSKIVANYMGTTGEAYVSVLLTHTRIEPGAQDGPSLFADAAIDGAAPRFVYPASGIIVPPNLNSFEFHYRPGEGNDLFEVEFTGALIQVKVYMRCTSLADGCVFEPEPELWELLASASRGQAPVAYTLRGLDSAATLPSAGSSVVHQMQFSSDDMLGGIYYWNANPGAIQRYDFGRRGQSAETYLSVSQTDGVTCVGCHSLSRAGDRIAVGYDIPSPAGLQTFDVATRSTLWGEGGGLMGTGGANFSAFSPDASEILTSGTGPIYLRSTETGGNKTEVVANGTMPDWAPDNSAVVFAQADTAGCVLPPQLCDLLPDGTDPSSGNPGVDKASIVSVVPGNWGNQITLAEGDGKNNYYPANSPDSEWVVYNRSNQNSFDAPDAQVWVVPATGGTSIQLANASPSAGGDSWPKWAPFQHSYQSGNSMMWLTFSSRRDYGLRLKNSLMPQDDQRSQIWMVGFDPAKAAAGEDGSFTAFWLPFQDLESGNHIAQWVEKIDRQPCGDSECPTGEFCEAGSCVPQIQ